MACHYFIGLDDKGNTREVFKNNKCINYICVLDLFSAIELFWSFHPLLASLCISPSADQLASHPMNIDERDVIRLPDY